MVPEVELLRLEELFVRAVALFFGVWAGFEGFEFVALALGGWEISLEIERYDWPDGLDGLDDFVELDGFVGLGGLGALIWLFTLHGVAGVAGHCECCS